MRTLLDIVSHASGRSGWKISHRLVFVIDSPLLKGLSKLANILFARQLQKNFDKANIDAISMALHPGLINTGTILKGCPLHYRILMVVFRVIDGVINWLSPNQNSPPVGRLTPAEGVETALFAATSLKVFAEKDIYKGAFLVPPGSIEALIGDASDDELAQELWATSERVMEAVFQDRYLT